MHYLFANQKLHLGYCLNIHPGESWSENFAHIKNETLQVRDRICPDRPFGLGLRLSNQAAIELSAPEKLCKFRDFLETENLYAFTINGFPYGIFHGTPVKTQVYQPDWTTPERVEYTRRLIKILAAILPPDTTGTISTVPLAYRRHHPARAKAMQTACRNLAAVAQYMHETEQKTGRKIMLALEPEPDCLCDRQEDVEQLFNHHLPQFAAPAASSHLGVCIDLCHAAVMFENTEKMLTDFAEQNIPAAKIQVSAAPKCIITPESLDALRDFIEPVYLHQTCIRDAENNIHRFPDLPQALQFCEDRSLAEVGNCELRTHFHVPLFNDSLAGSISTTAVAITTATINAAVQAGATQFEVETYSFDAIKPEYRPGSVVESIVQELEWFSRSCNIKIYPPHL